MRNGDHLHLVEPQAIHESERKPAKQDPARAMEPDWPPKGSLSQAGHGSIQLGQEGPRRLGATLLVPFPCNGCLRGRIRMEDDFHEMSARDPLARLWPGLELRRPLIDFTDPSLDLHRPGSLGIGIDLGIETLQQRARERCPCLGREVKRTLEQIPHVGHRNQHTSPRLPGSAPLTWQVRIHDRSVHYHVLWLDGAYAWQPGRKVAWHGHGGVRDEDVARLVVRIRDRRGAQAAQDGEVAGRGR